MRVLALAIVVMLLAGCGGTSNGANKVRLGDGNLVSLDLREDQQPAEDDLYGAVSGIVVDDAIYPVPGADVLVKGLDRRVPTDENGRFVFETVPPGLWVLQVQKPGHFDGLGTLNVKSGDVAKSVIQIKRLPYVAPYHQTVSISAFSSLATRLAEGTRDHVIGLDGNPKTILVEVAWDDLVAATDPLEYQLTAEAHEPATFAGAGPNPLRVDLDGEELPADAYALRVDVHPTPTAVPPDSAGRIFVTAFYIEPAPPGWSFLRGDT